MDNKHRTSLADYVPPTTIVGLDGREYAARRPLRKLPTGARLVELHQRRARGESLRSLAAWLDVAPSTLWSYFAKIEGRA